MSNIRVDKYKKKKKKVEISVYALLYNNITFEVRMSPLLIRYLRD